MIPSDVRIATHADRDAVAAMLAQAFADDPAMAYIFPDPEVRARRMPRLFALLFKTDGPAGMRLMTAAGEAATLWRGPGKADTGMFELLRQALPMFRALGWSLPRALKVADAIDAHHPPQPFWYLHIAGCDPAFQGKGLGGAAVRAGLDRISAERLPTYLETPLEKNIGFYQGLGFDLTGDWRVPGGGPHFWSMLRPA